MQATAKTTLASLVEENITELVREAVTIQRHSKRARFHPSTNDTTHDAGDRQQGILRRRIHAQDINLALQWRGSEKLYGTPLVVPTEAAVTRKVDLNEYVKSEQKLPPPSELGLTMHWLAVDGEQPNIPQNPVVVNLARARTDVAHKVEDEESGTVPEGGDDESVRVRQLLPRLLSEELQLYFTRITLAVETGGATAADRQTQDAALLKVARDSGLQELVPFFVQYISQNLFDHVNQPEHCRTLIRLTRSLLLNPYLHLELHLHQMLPALITSIVARSLGGGAEDNHWALRLEAAQVLLQACDLFGEEYATLKSRVLKTMVEATAPGKALATQFGGIIGITLFGPKAIDAFLMTICVPYWKKWENALLAEKGTKPLTLSQQTEVHECQQALLNGMGIFLQQTSLEEQVNRMDFDELADTFGEKLVPLANLDTADYAFCFV